jgi:hypothetical protein
MMTYILGALGILLVVVFLWLLYALCRAAGDADDAAGRE